MTALLGDRRALFAIRVLDLRQDVEKAGEAITPFLGKIGSGKKRLAGGGQEHRQRPAAGAARQQRVRRLVNLVEIGTFFAIDLDRSEERRVGKDVSTRCW